VALPLRGEVVALPARRSPARAAFVALRPRQWVKNLLLFAGILFAGKLGDPIRWLEAFTAFAAYCAASSAAYLVNDVRDAPQDRAHPVKRARPIARGEVATRRALVLAAVLTAAAFALVAPLGAGSVALLAGFLVLQAAYTLGLKRVVLVDVMAIAGLFVIRAAAGAEAVDVPISPWLLACTLLLALFLALGKRRGELVLVGARATPGRPVLTRYSLPLVDQLLTIAAAATVATYVLYAIVGRETKALMVTIPFAVFGVFRYLVLVHRRDLGEEPEEVILRDPPILVAVGLWAVAAAIAPAVA
jgi:4-hydroxybenzoate polyprenyltransferase